MNRRALLYAVVALALIAPAALAQMPPPVRSVYSETVVFEKGPAGVFTTLGVELKGLHGMGGPSLPIYAGLDNTFNLTIRNNLDTWWNVTYLVNATGEQNVGGTNVEVAVSATPGRIEVAVPPHATRSEVIVVRPSEPASIRVTTETADKRSAPGGGTGDTWIGWAVPAASIRFIDPPPQGGLSDADGEYERSSSHSGTVPSHAGFLRMRPGESLVARIEVRNPLPVPLPAFDLAIEGREGPIDRVAIPSLDGGATRTFTFRDYTPQVQPYSNGERFDLWPVATFKVGAAETKVGAASFRVERGAASALQPAFVILEVHRGVVIDVLVPKAPQLGAPTRIKYNLTNYASTPVKGVATVRLDTPYGLMYPGVQIPESRSIPISLAPDETVRGALEFTPRVTGQWNVGFQVRSDSQGGYGYGGTAGIFVVRGGIQIDVDRANDFGGVIFARISEPVQVDLTITSPRVIDNAELRIASRAQSGWYPGMEEAQAGQWQPGMMQNLLRTSRDSTPLGTLRPGGEVDATIEVVSAASGRYTVFPFVYANGFAYTHDFSYASEQARSSRGMDVYYPGGGGSGMGTIDIAVQNRRADTPWALAPLTVGVAVFVGAWTLRTRFVR